MSEETAVDGADAPAEEAVVVTETMFGVPVLHSGGQVVLHPTREGYPGLLRDLHEDGFHSAVDLCGVDFLTHPGRDLPAGVTAERFEVVVNLINHRNRSRVRVRLQVPEADPVVPSATSLYPGLDAPERETFDMFGIAFDGHPDLTRILMPEDWIGHPLRKDYDIGRIPVQFKEAPAVRR
ncbi:MAG: NADH-quinone oxidoreductase subunit C [Actinobacteria bacterium]|nr:NADH-quinone oxidoreductase subunit C [Actinomycetota bacterium]